MKPINTHKIRLHLIAARKEAIKIGLNEEAQQIFSLAQHLLTLDKHDQCDDNWDLLSEPLTKDM